MPARVLTIAGSDSGGGAGIQADLKVMTAQSVYGMSVITAVTSQNTLNVDAVEIISADMVEKQFRAIMTDIGCDVVKTGMLGDANNVKRIAGLLEELRLTMTVIDPVMIATSGSVLLQHEAIASMISDLLPLAYIITPNIPEARLLLAEAQGKRVEDLPPLNGLEDMKQLARDLLALGPKHVLLKGGHLPLNEDLTLCTHDSQRTFVSDVLCSQDTTTVITSKWSASRNTHGTGCSLASAIASQLALKSDVTAAVKHAIEYIHGAITHSFDLGSGCGPLNHMYRLSSLPFIPGHFVDYLIGHESVQGAWKAYTEHAFVRQLADGTLPISCFKHFLRQDYLYLIQYARLQGLVAYKSEDLDTIVDSAKIILHIRQELDMHIEYCKSFGISRVELDAGRESIACTVYTKYIEGIGNSRDIISLQVAMAACLIGYGEVGKRLYNSTTIDKSSVYYTWIKTYAEADFSTAVEAGRTILEKHAVNQSNSKISELVEIFRRVTEYEALFWTDALAATLT